jgi:hypothetical protein
MYSLTFSPFLSFLIFDYLILPSFTNYELETPRMWPYCTLLRGICTAHCFLQSESLCDWRSVSLSVLVSSTFWVSWPELSPCSYSSLSSVLKSVPCLSHWFPPHLTQSSLTLRLTTVLVWFLQIRCEFRDTEDDQHLSGLPWGPKSMVSRNHAWVRVHKDVGWDLQRKISNSHAGTESYIGWLAVARRTEGVT